MTINYKFLTIEDKDVRLIGYKLKLSPSERTLLAAIADKDGASIEELLPLLAEGISRGNVAVHINAINKKAESISSRKLVLFENGKYVINPYM